MSEGQTPGLKEAVRQMAELREGHACMFAAQELAGMLLAYHQLQMVRNQHMPNLDVQMLEQRKAIIDIPGKILRRKIHKYIREEFLPALEAWEKEFPI